MYRFVSINNSICCHGVHKGRGTKEGKNINTNGSAIERFVDIKEIALFSLFFFFFFFVVPFHVKDASQRSLARVELAAKLISVILQRYCVSYVWCRNLEAIFFFFLKKIFREYFVSMYKIHSISYETLTIIYIYIYTERNLFEEKKR